MENKQKQEKYINVCFKKIIHYESQVDLQKQRKMIGLKHGTKLKIN